MTELEYAQETFRRVNELNAEIEKVRAFQLNCKKNNDNIGDKIWADRIKSIREERHVLTESVRYASLKVFIDVMKTYLTKEQYEEAWRKVEQLTGEEKVINK